jgi:transposase
VRQGRPLAPLQLRDSDRDVLERWTRRQTSANALATRARIVLASAQGESNSRIAARLRLTPQTVGKWRARYVSKGLDGLLDEPRPGTPRTVSDEQVERVLTLTVESMPTDATHWSTRAISPGSDSSGVPTEARALGGNHSRVPRKQQRESDAICLDQDGGRDPGKDANISVNNF